MSGKYSQKLLDHANKSAIEAPKGTSKIVIQKTEMPKERYISLEIIDYLRLISWYNNGISKNSRSSC